MARFHPELRGSDRTGGTKVLAGAWRITFGATLAMLLTADVGARFDSAVS